MKNICAYAAIFFTFLFTNPDAVAETEIAHREDFMQTKNKDPSAIDAFDFVQRIYRGALNDEFLEKDFFAKDNLIAFTNSKSIENLGENENFFIANGVEIDGISGQISIVRNQGEKRATNLALSFSSLVMKVDYLTSIFGPVQKIRDPYKDTPAHHSVMILKETHQFGNMEVSYIKKGRRSKTEIISLVLGNGYISKINVIQTWEQ